MRPRGVEVPAPVFDDDLGRLRGTWSFPAGNSAIQFFGLRANSIGAMCGRTPQTNLKFEIERSFNEIPSKVTVSAGSVAMTTFDPTCATERFARF